MASPSLSVVGAASDAKTVKSLPGPVRSGGERMRFIHMLVGISSTAVLADDLVVHGPRWRVVVGAALVVWCLCWFIELSVDRIIAANRRG